jgi:hypothetical protein
MTIVPPKDHHSGGSQDVTEPDCATRVCELSTNVSPTSETRDLPIQKISKVPGPVTSIDIVCVASTSNLDHWIDPEDRHLYYARLGVELPHSPWNKWARTRNRTFDQHQIH